jgi:hypothetical protein
MDRLQNERESKIDDLLNWAVMAHGGLDRWNSFRTVAFEFSLGGALWDVKGQTGLLADSIFEADIHKQRATLGRFGASDRRVRFAPDRLVLESNAGKEIQVRVNPRAAFAGHVLETPWDQLHAAYFGGYALWNCVMQPFLYTYPGFATTEIEPWEEDGECWRRLRVIFPDNIVSHTREEISYFGPDGLMRRLDYAVDVLGGATGVHYIGDYGGHDGILMPHWRRVYLRGADNRKVSECVSIAIDIGRFAFGSA